MRRRLESGSVKDGARGTRRGNHGALIEIRQQRRLIRNRLIHNISSHHIRKPISSKRKLRYRRDGVADLEEDVTLVMVGAACLTASTQIEVRTISAFVTNSTNRIDSTNVARHAYLHF